MQYLHSTSPSMLDVCYVIPSLPSYSVATAVATRDAGLGRPPAHDIVPNLIKGLVLPRLLDETWRWIGDAPTPGDIFNYNVRGRKPSTIQYSPTRDWAIYGSHAIGFLSLFRGDFGRPMNIHPLYTKNGEKGVRHVRLDGSARQAIAGDKSYYVYGDDPAVSVVYNCAFPLFSRVDTHWDGGTTGVSERSVRVTRWGISKRYAAGEYTGGVNIPYPASELKNLVPYVDLINEGHLDDVYTYDLYGRGWYMWNTIRDFKLDFEPQSLNVSYKLTNYSLDLAQTSPGGPYTYHDWKAEYNVSITSKVVATEYTSDGDDTVIRAPTILLETTYKALDVVRLGSGPSIDFGTWSGGVDTHIATMECYPIMASPPTSQWERSMYIDPVFRKPANLTKFLASPGPFSPLGDTLLSAFQETVHRMLPHIRCSASRSFEDGISKFEGALKNNNLEMLSELSSIFKIMPDLVKASRFMYYFKQGRLLRAIDALLDFATDTKLLIDFGIKPNVGAVTEVVTKANYIKDRLSVQTSTQTAYGKFQYDFPTGTFDFEEARLVTRTKLRVSSSEAALAKVLMASAALGVQPSLKNAWNIVPFSFVADWFVNLSSRFDNIDAYIKAFIYEVDYCVHSYAIEVVVDEDYLQKFGMTTGETPVTLRYYLREVSHLPPALRDSSRFDFELPTRDPNKGIAGSLVYQLIR